MPGGSGAGFGKTLVDARAASSKAAATNKRMTAKKTTTKARVKTPARTKTDAGEASTVQVSRADPTPDEAAARLVFDRLAKDGGIFDKSCTGKLIRELNTEGYWADFGAKVTSAHATLTGEEGRTAVATREQFVAFYPSLLAETRQIQAQWDAQDAARMRAATEQAEAAAKARATEFAPNKAEWEVRMKRLPLAFKAAWEHGKTPLVVDCTTLPGDDKNSTFSPLETFYSYSGEVLVELKRAVVEVGMRKEKTLEELHDELAKKLLVGLKQGRSLILLCSNSAPPLASQFMTSARFPLALLDATLLRGALEAAELETTFLGPLLEWKDQTNGLANDPSTNLVFAHADFRVVVVTKFSPEDYREFLASELPLEQLQPIKVFTESS